MILFVGSNPSRASKNPSMPFNPDTKSGSNLRAWIDIMRNQMGLNYGESLGFTNISSIVTVNNRPLKAFDLLEDQISRIECHCSVARRVIVVGSVASRALTKLDIDHFKLPHSSPRNRQLNDPDYIHSQLRSCALFLA